MLKKNQNSTKSKSNRRDNLGGFKVLKWKLNPESTVIRHFFIKSHSTIRGELNPKKPVGRTLFVINIPAYLNEPSLHELFSKFGPINSVFLHQNPTSSLPVEQDLLFPDPNNQIKGSKVAYIVFQHPTSLKAATEIDSDSLEPMIIDQSTFRTGLRKWTQEYNDSIIPRAILEEHVRTYMNEYEKDEIRKKEEAKNNDGSVGDEDGWIKVESRGKRKGTPRTEKMQKYLQAKKQKFDKQLMNFTPTQIKETRVKQLSELKKKFDEDRQRVHLLRQQRKFKPF